MKKYIIVTLLALILLLGCSGEGYIKVKNETPATVMVSVNNLADEVLGSGDTTDTYTVTLTRGVLNNIPVSATGEWLGEYTESVSLSSGETVIHKIQPQLADISIVNTSVDSVYCRLEDSYYIYLAGGESENDKYPADGNVSLEYEGPYFFNNAETLSWFPGYTYTRDLIPDACEIQLNNEHGNRAIYYVYISPGDVDTWGDDKLGDDTILYPSEAFVWKAEGGVHWDMRIEAGDPHPDSALYVYEFYDEEGCDADYTWIYEFPAIFDPATVSKSSKTDPASASVVKSRALHKTVSPVQPPVRIEKIGKKDAGKAVEKALRK